MKAIAKSVILLTILLAVQVYAVPDPGRIYSSPRVLDDTLNADAILRTGLWLHNPSDSFSVNVSDITLSQPWMTLLMQPGITVLPNDSILFPIEINSIGYSGQNLTGSITVEHDGFNSPNLVDVKIHVTTNPPVGGLIDIMPTQLNFEFEPNMSDEFYLYVTNLGDLNLNITNVLTSSPVIMPAYSSLSVAPTEEKILRFYINTYSHENMYVQDTIKIFSDATNFPLMSVLVSIHIRPDSVGGVFGYGDANSDGWFNIMDLYSLVSYFGGTGPMPCFPAADMNNDGSITGVDVSYAVGYLNGLFPGNPPNICPYPVSNFLLHLPNRQIQIANITAHRGEWVQTPVFIQSPSFYLMQSTMGFMGNIVDSVNIFQNSTHPELTPKAHLLDTDSISKTIVFYEQNMSTTRTPMYFPSPMPIYDLQLHIPIDAPVGNHQLFPKTAIDRGPSFFNSTGDSIEAAMFTGTNLTIAPRVLLAKLSGVGELIYVPDSTIIHPSITVYCDGPAMGDVYMVIRDSSGVIAYTDTIHNFPLILGENHILFTHTWIARGGHNYIAGAGVVVDGDDYPTDNFGGIRINMTSQKTIGLPPPEGFETGLILSFPPVGYSVIKRPDPPGGTPTWHETSEKAHSGTQSVAVLGQTDDVNDEWFIKGPMDWTSVNEPEIQFYEAQYAWTEYGYSHEFYVYVGEEFNVDDAIAGGAIATHTPGTHTISTSFSTAPLQEFDLSAYGNTNNVWFAFRYLKDPEKLGGDNWYIDDITWVDNAPGPAGYEYIPGDANMGIVSWPTLLEGGDVIRLVRYFKGLNPACMFHNPSAHHAPAPDTLADTVFYAAADANGNCETRGSDVQRIVAYFKGIADAPVYCIDYPPITPIQANFPACTTPALKK